MNNRSSYGDSGLAAIAIAVTIVIAMSWIIIATIMRMIAWIVCYMLASFALALVVGMVVGVSAPLRVLLGRSVSKPDIATPEKVVARQVIRHQPAGFTKHFGWDKAWPEYNPYQAVRDAAAVYKEITLVRGATWRKVRLSPRWVILYDAYGTPIGTKQVGGSFTKLVWGIAVPAPFGGFVVGMYTSYALWLLVMGVIGGAVYLCQQAWTITYRWWDRAVLMRVRAQVKCPHCYETNPRPSYCCPNRACPIIHRDISPGPLGIIKRRCECGTHLPTTIRGASKILVALCPSCDEPLAQGSGARRTIQLPAFGSVGAGKTRFFAAAMTAARKQLSSSNGSLKGLNTEARGFLKASSQAMTSEQATEKTIHTMRPEGRPFVLTQASGQVLELQIMDAAGESFTTFEGTEELTYVNSARTMIFVLDPLALPRVREDTGSAPHVADTLVATGNQEAAYASVVDRLRSEAIDLSKRNLAVVLTKTEILRNYPSGKNLDPTTTDGVRDWLNGVDQDGFVRRMEGDFGTVRYFAVDSLALREPDDPLNPLRVMNWALTSQKVPIALVSSEGKTRPEAVDTSKVVDDDEKASVS